jgi:hypothetical protein
MKKIVLALLVLTVAFSTFAESKASPDAKMADALNVNVQNVDFIKGVVTDKVSKEALVGVAVECNGQKTYTDLDGCFSLRKSPISKDLVVSLISYENQTLKVDNLKESNINIELRQR